MKLLVEMAPDCDQLMSMVGYIIPRL